MVRAIPVLVFWVITIWTCGQTAFLVSATVGIAAFVACALCYGAAAGFAGSVISRQQNHYRLFDLVGIGALAIIVFGVGLVLMVWSEFRLSLFDVRIEGVVWAICGALSALFVIRPRDAIAGNISKTGHRLQ